jgi:branched-chain amino acid transport system ATP-binding protein
MPDLTNPGAVPGHEPGDEPLTVAPDTSDHDVLTMDVGPEGETLLEIDHVTLRFGGVVALNDVNFSIKRGEILGLIGPNGAGKTTCFNVMTGVYTPTAGEVRLNRKVISGTKPHKINALGIARTFQNIRLFPEMSALENVMVGCDARHKTSVIGALFRAYRIRPDEADMPTSPLRRKFAKVFGISRHTVEERAGRRKSMELLKFVGIADRAHDLSRNLPYGYQRRLEIARALATEPELICLDEPAAGFNPAEKEDLMDLIRRIRDLGHTVLVIEHDMKLVLGVTDRIVVLEFGQQIAEGSPEEVARNPKVIAAYLGEPDDAA